MKIAAVIAFGILLGGSAYVAGTANITMDARGLVDASAAHGADAASCARLTLLKLPHTTVTSAQVVPAGQFKAPEGNASFSDLPAFCRVSMTIAPSSDSDIKTEIWLPVAGWNGKFQEVGNGGWNGFIQYAALATALRRGYAAASTDTGHVGDTASFAPGPSREADRFRISRGARDGARGQGHYRRALRRGAALLVFHGLLGRRPAGVHGGAALSRGFRGHRRGRSRLRSLRRKPATHRCGASHAQRCGAA